MIRGKFLVTTVLQHKGRVRKMGDLVRKGAEMRTPGAKALILCGSLWHG